MTFIERTVYDMFDLVRDLGGLVGGTHGFFFVLISLLQVNDLNFTMISMLYSKDQLAPEDHDPDDAEKSPLNKKKVNTIKLNFLFYLSKLCKVRR